MTAVRLSFRHAASLLMVLVSLMAGLCGCSSGDDPSEEVVIYDIVRLVSAGDDGSVFTLSASGSRSEVTLTSGVTISDDRLAIGDRLLIAYIPEGGRPYVSGPVALRGYMLIINGVAKPMSPDEIEGWDSDPVYLLSAWLMGDCLNLRLRLPYDENPRRFDLAVDSDSDPLRPDLYLIHSRQEDILTFDRAYYASFDLSALSGANGFTLHINNSNLHLDAIPFDF